MGLPCAAFFSYTAQMAGIDERDAKLILRAEDRATKTFQSVSKSVDELTGKLKDQVKAAEAGEGSLEGLTSILREFEQIGKDLVNQQAAIKAFEKLAGASDKVTERVDRTTKSLADYTAKQEAAGKDAAGSTFDRLATNVERAAKAQDEYTRKVDAARERLTALGLTAENTATEFAAINGVAVRTATAISQATDATRGFAAAQAVATRESQAGVAAEQQRRRALLDGAADVLAGNKTLEASYEQLNAEIAHTSNTNSLRLLGADAVAAASNLNRFAQTGEATVAGVTRLADAVRQIVTPTLATVQTLDGALAQVEESANIAATTQKKRVSEYQDSLNGLSQAQATLMRQATNIDAYTKQVAVVDRLDAELGQAAARYRELGAAAAAAEAPNEQLSKDLTAAGRALESAGTAAKAARTTLSELQDTLKRGGVDANNLTGEIARLQQGAARSAPVFDDLTTKVGGNGKGFLGLKGYELQNLSYQVNDVFTSLASGISPTQTLAQQGGQIAQIFPGFVSNLIKFLPLVAAAGAGIALLVYNLNEAKKSADAIRSFTAEFALFGDSVGLSAKQFAEAQIALERVGVSADDARKGLRSFIDSGQDSAGLDSFLVTVRGIVAATGEDFPTAAKQFSDALTKGYDSVASLNDITHTLTDAQLAQVKGLYDAGKAQEARTLVDEIYRKQAQGIADASRSDWTVQTQRLADAFRKLADAFDTAGDHGSLLKRALDPIIALIGRLRESVELINSLRGGLASVSNYSLPALFQGRFGRPAPPVRPTSALDSIASVNADFKANPAKVAQSGNSTNATNRRTAAGQKFLDQQKTELRQAKLLSTQQRLDDAAQDAGNKAAEAGLNAQEVAQARLNARKIEQQKIDKENETASNKADAAARKAESAREKAAREAATKANAIAELSKQVEAIDLTFGAKAASQDDPFAPIKAGADKAINELKDKFRKLNLLGVTTVDGKTEAQFEARVRAGEAIQVQQATLKKNEEDLNSLLDQRKQKLAAIEDQLSAGLITPAAALAAQTAVFDDLNPQIKKAADNAERYARGVNAAKPDPKALQFAEKAASAGSKATSGTDLFTAAQSDVNKSKATLDALVAQRNATIQLHEALEKVGLESAPQAQKAIANAFKTSRPEIEAAADSTLALINQILALQNLPPQAVAALTTLKAQVEDTRASTQALTGDQLVLRNAAYQALSKGVGDFITSIGDAVAGAIDGSKNLGEVLSDIGNAALSFAANFTKAIAQAIVQLLALQAAKSILKAVGLSAIGLHEGGIVGQDATFTRTVSPLAMLGAIRYHSGGLVGLRPDEVPAILQRGEEVITAADPRHRDNGGLAPGSGAAPNVNIKNINLFDAGEAVSQGANTGPGERAILNVLSRNPSFVRGLAGG